MLRWCACLLYSIHRNEANLMRYDEHQPFKLHFCFDMRWFTLFITNFHHSSSFLAFCKSPLINGHGNNSITTAQSICTHSELNVEIFTILIFIFAKMKKRESLQQSWKFVNFVVVCCWVLLKMNLNSKKNVNCFFLSEFLIFSKEFTSITL